MNDPSDFVGPVQVEVERAANAVRDCQLLIKLGRLALERCEIALGTYFEMVSFIRTARLSPLEVRETLEKVGFARSRISEVNRLANASDVLWGEISNKKLQWRAALQKVRGEKLSQEAKSKRRLNLAVSTVFRFAVRIKKPFEARANGWVISVGPDRKSRSAGGVKKKKAAGEAASETKVKR